MVITYGDFPDPLSGTGKWKFTLNGKKKRIEVRRLEDGKLVVCKDELRDLDIDISQEALTACSHALNYIEVKCFLKLPGLDNFEPVNETDSV